MQIKRLAIVSWLVLVGVTTARAQQPVTGSWREEVRRVQRPVAPRPATVRAPRAASILVESEPNDSVATADSAALGNQGTGVVNPAGDVDTWFVDLTAGQFFSVDVDARSIGSFLDPLLSVIAPDGHTVVAFNDDFDGSDSRITYRVPADGRYYVQVTAFGGVGFPILNYAINFGTVTCGAVGAELEPNDTPASATRMAIGDSVVGEVCAHDASVAGDVDYWAFTAQAGTTVELQVDVVVLGLSGDPFVALFASDGTTRLAFNDNAGFADSRLQFSIAATGTYYAAVSTVADPGGNPFHYTLHVRSVTAGPGDPIAVRAEGVGRPLGLAVGNTGDIFVADERANRVVRIAGGVATTFVAGIPIPTSVAFDATGQLLVASPTDRAVYRITPQGVATRFITDASFPFWIAVAPDGRIWITNLQDKSLRRYSATGQFETRVVLDTLGAFGPGPLAIGPSGEPYFSTGFDIWRLHGGQPERVLHSAFVIWAFAFDAAGRIYVPAPAAGRILLFDAAGTLLSDPFAVGPDAPQALAFGRDGTGATVARLFATDPNAGRVIELNPAGVTQRGAPAGFVAPPFSADVAAAMLLGAGGVNAGDRQYLDAVGNHNGRYDVGDLQAYLRLVGHR